MNEIIKKNGINYGVITGVVTILVNVLVYLIDVTLMIDFLMYQLPLLLFYIVFAVVLLSKTKKQLNGIYSFKDAFTTYFIYAVVGMVISLIFSYILFNFIDTQAADTIKEASIEKIVATFEKFNIPIDANTEAKLQEMQGKNMYSLTELLKGSAFGLIFSVIIGLILALIFRSKPQVE